MALAIAQRSPDEQAPEPRGSPGFSIVEVLVATLIVAVGILGTLVAFSSAELLASNAGRQAKAGAVAQREIDRLSGLPYAEVALAAAPVGSTSGELNPSDPNDFVSGSQLLIKTDYHNMSSGPPPGVSAAGEPFVLGGALAAGPEAFEVDGSTGRIYRYVTWLDDTCTVVVIELCPGAEDQKRVTVAVVLDGVGNRAGPKKPVYVSTIVSDPDALPLSQTGLPSATPGSGLAVSSQALFLTDTPCSASAWQATGGSHTTDDTSRLGATCSGSNTPDLMTPSAPPDAVGQPVLDLSTDLLRTNPQGLALKREGTGCPTSYTILEAATRKWSIHTWASTPLPLAFASAVIDPSAALVLWTRSVGGVVGPVDMCITLRSAALPLLPLAQTVLHLDAWPTSWTQLSYVFSHAPFALLLGDRMLLTLSVKAASTGDVEILFDHPDYRSFLSVATTTPFGT